MSNRSPPLTDIGQFYKQIEDLKNKLTIIFKQYNKEQEIINLNKYYDKLILLKKANVRTPIELFYKYVVVQYTDSILTRDDVFFLGKVSNVVDRALSDEKNDYTYFIGNESHKETITQKDLFFFSQIREVWQNLANVIRDNIWNYVQIICILAEKIVGGNTLAPRREILKKNGTIH